MVMPSEYKITIPPFAVMGTYGGVYGTFGNYTPYGISSSFFKSFGGGKK